LFFDNGWLIGWPFSFACIGAMTDAFDGTAGAAHNCNLSSVALSKAR